MFLGKVSNHARGNHCILKRPQHILHVCTARREGAGLLADLLSERRRDRLACIARPLGEDSDPVKVIVGVTGP
jgi:hypothetical protein